MGEIFVQEFEIVEKNEDERNKELIDNVMKAKLELRCANQNFESAEKDLVDYYIYEIKATQAKLDYLIRKAKKRGIFI